MHSEPSFSLLCVCKSVQSGGFTLPNCFLKSHKRDLQNVLSLAKTEHIISPSDLMRFSITFEFFEYFLFEVPEQEFFLWSRRFSFKVLIEYIVSFYVTGSCFRCSIFQRLPNYQKSGKLPTSIIRNKILMLAKSIISDQNFLTKRRIELAQNKNVVGRQGWFWRPKGFILQKKTWSLLRNV